MRARLVAVATSLALLGATFSAFAQLYRWIDERGVIHYADAAPPAHRTERTMAAQAMVPAAAASRMRPAGTRFAAASPLLPGSPSAVDRATAERLPRSLGRTASAPLHALLR
jgi:Domain of unknown function (DUF4124)